MNSVWRCFKGQTEREIWLHFRQVRLVLNGCLFFFMVLVFFPLTFPPDTALLRALVPGLIWVAALLAALLSAERLFVQEHEEGVLELWLVSGYPLSVFVVAKLLVHWGINLLPALLLMPLLGVLFALTGYELQVVLWSFVCGTPAIFALCALAASFSVGVKQKGVFMGLILLPLAIPVMIFGSGAITAAMQGFAVQGHLALLAAFSLLAMGLLPFAIAGVIRVSLSTD